MSKSTLIESIKAINESISYDEEINIFSLKEVDAWFDIATQIKNLNFDYLMCITSIDMEENQLALAYNIHSTETKRVLCSIETNCDCSNFDILFLKLRYHLQKRAVGL